MSRFTMPVSRYMTAPVHTIPSSSTLRSAHDQLGAQGISSLAVTGEDGRLAGVLSQSDLLRLGRYRALAQPGPAAAQPAPLLTLPDRPLAAIMTRDVATVGPDEPVSRACQLMLERQIHRVFVLAGDELAGVLSTRDVMEAICDQRVKQPVEQFMSRPLFTAAASEPISVATELLSKAHISGLVVVEDDWPVGLFTHTDALKARDLPGDTPVEDAMNAALLCLPAATPLFRAAQQMLAMRARRIIASDKRDMVGIVSGLDFARAAL